jgi:O-antigen biosynthesis protein WbqP
MDLLIVLLALAIFALPMMFIAIVIKAFCNGPVLFWSERVGQRGKIFKMPKFRTMHVGTPIVSSNDLSFPNSHLTKTGKVLRRTSMDELPQLWSVLIGHMSVVGPRPALVNQTHLQMLREKYGIQNLKPGITGLAQINGRDDLSDEAKVEFDLEYLNSRGIISDMLILVRTIPKVVQRTGIKH